MDKKSKTHLTRPLAIAPQEFVEKWDLTHAELAELVGVSVDSVNSWMEGRRKPLEPVKRLLAEIDARWSWHQSEPPEYRKIYERKGEAGGSRTKYDVA